MATVCLDYHSLSISSANLVDVCEALPKIENQVGDIPYTLEATRVLILKENIKHPDNCIGLKAFSVAIILLSATIVGLLGGKVMYYIPLYVALTPVVYWLLKIVYAYYVVKIKKLHVDSESFSGNTHG
ncbi:TPA: hypothetical protein MI387_00205 [Klebsiella pneumoniae]|nr:hypothetical protein [Klebsiella pneumoniae]